MPGTVEVPFFMGFSGHWEISHISVERHKIEFRVLRCPGEEYSKVRGRERARPCMWVGGIREGFSQEVREAKKNCAPGSGSSQCKGPVAPSHSVWLAVLAALVAQLSWRRLRGSVAIPVLTPDPSF